jgi:hypothetical protein
VDRREVEHVEAQLLDAGQQALTVFESSVLARLLGGRAREELVPGAEQFLLPAYPHAQVFIVNGGEELQGRGQHHLLENGAEHQLDRLAIGSGIAHLIRKFAQLIGFGFAIGIGSLAQQIGPDLELHFHILPRFFLFQETVVPIEQVVDPALDFVLVKPFFLDPETGLPDVVGLALHDHFRPFLLVFMAIVQGSADGIVPIAEDVGRHLDDLARDAFDEVLPVIDFRLDILDDDAVSHFAKA